MRWTVDFRFRSRRRELALRITPSSDQPAVAPNRVTRTIRHTLLLTAITIFAELVAPMLSPQVSRLLHGHQSAANVEVIAPR